jgi:hypothetical protein
MRRHLEPEAAPIRIQFWEVAVAKALTAQSRLDPYLGRSDVRRVLGPSQLLLPILNMTMIRPVAKGQRMWLRGNATKD